MNFSQANNSNNNYESTGGFSGMNDNNNIYPMDTRIPSDHNQHIPNNTPSNSLPNNNNNQQPIFTNDNANTQNYQRQSMPSNISTTQFNPQYNNQNPPQSNVYQQQSMPSNGSTPQSNSQYNPPQSNDQQQFMPSNGSIPQYNNQNPPQSNVYQQQFMPSNGSTPQSNSQYIPNPPQSNVGVIIINSSQMNIYNTA